MSACRHFYASVAIFLVACGGAPEVSGTVKDIWGKPIEGASVQIEGLQEQPHTDGQGAFLIEVPVGPHRLMAGKDGYIKGMVSLDVKEEAEAPLRADFLLYPEPSETGFYSVGASAYQKIEPQNLTTFGTALRAYTGLADVGHGVISHDFTSRFVFSSKLRSSELSRIDLQLHRIEFVASTKVPGLLGEEEVKVNLWTGVESIPFTIEGLPSKDDYLISPKEKLKPGVYAFNTQGLITSADVNALENTPRELREAWPFEVK